MSMTSRDRLFRSLNHQEPDRLPIFSPNIIDTYEPYDPELKQFLETFPFDAFAPVGELMNPPDRLRPADGEEQDATSRQDQILVDGYGCRYQNKGVGLPYSLHHPLAGAETIGDVEAFPWPDPYASAPETGQVIARARTIHAPRSA